MRSDTQAVTIDADPAVVLAFVGNGENLPRWAVGFAKAVCPAESGWIVTTSQGQVRTSIAVDEATGTVDFRMQPGPGTAATAYARVLSNGPGAEFVFTQMQQSGMPDEVFE